MFLTWFSMSEFRILTRRTRQEVRMQSETTSRMSPTHTYTQFDSCGIDNNFTE